jgi:hypothetical protein
MALVFAAGFRGSASRVRSRSGCLVYYAGPGRLEMAERFDAWWYDAGAPLGPCWFWGDLDFAGMQILKSLRDRFDGLDAWPPGYESMLVQLQKRDGYGARIEDAKGQVDPILTGCPYADTTLLPAIRQCADGPGVERGAMKRSICHAISRQSGRGAHNPLIYRGSVLTAA